MKEKGILHQAGPVQRFYVRFTLIELLVVVAIIGILAALLLPALKRAKDYSSLARCQGNLRQIGLAYIGYANDWEGWGPVGNETDGSSDWLILLAEGLGTNPASISSGFNDANYGPKKMPVLQCPSTYGKYTVWGPSTYAPNKFFTALNNAGDDFKGFFQPQQFMSPQVVRKHSDLLIFSESLATTQIVPFWNTSGIRNLFLISHLNKLNYLMGDGHVDSATYKEKTFLINFTTNPGFATKNGNEVWGQWNNGLL